MKNIQAQYQDLLEGKTSSANFMVSVRRDFPQWVSSTNSFKDAVSILKSKRIITEMRGLGKWAMDDVSQEERDAMDAAIKRTGDRRDSMTSEDKWVEAVDRILTQMKDAGDIDDVQFTKAMKVTSNPAFIANYKDGSAAEAAHDLAKTIVGENLGTAQDEFDASQQGLNEEPEASPQAIEVALHTMFDDGLIDDITWKTASKALPHFNIDDHVNMTGTTTAEDLAKELILIATGKHVEDMQDDGGEEEDPRFDDFKMNKRGLNEAVIKNPNAEVPQEVGYNHVNYRQLMKGMEFELAKAKEITDDALIKAKQTALKNIKKDPNAYRELMVANVKDVLKKDATLKMQPVKKDNLVDKANGMKVIKKDEKGNVQATLGKKEKASKSNKGVKEMTQAPKKVKGVQAFETPGKEKVLALKEHMLMEFGHMQQEVTPEFRVGSRVETKDGKLTGVVSAFDGHIATVKLDSDGSERDLQPNILKHSSTTPKTAEAMTPEVASMGKEEKLKAIKEKLMKFVKKEMEEGAVAQTASGITIASGMNPGEVAKRATDLKKQTGDPITVVDTKSGAKRKI